MRLNKKKETKKMDEMILDHVARMIGQDTGEDWLPAIVSIEMQEFGEPYAPEQGFTCGTVFPALNKPFKAGEMRHE